MKYYELKSSLKKSNIIESVRSYLQLIEKTEEGKILINGLNTNHKTIEEASSTYDSINVSVTLIS